MLNSSSNAKGQQPRKHSRHCAYAVWCTFNYKLAFTAYHASKNNVNENENTHKNANVNARENKNEIERWRIRSTDDVAVDVNDDV